MSNNLDWLFKARRPYWEEIHPGKRYRMFRSIKGNVFKGEYTLEAVHSRTNIGISALRNIESGAMLDETYVQGVLPVLIKDLGLTEEQFNTKEKIRPDPLEKEPKAEPKNDSSPRKTPKTPVRKAKSTAHKSDPSTEGLSIVNHTLMTFVLIQKGNELHILDDCASSLRGGKDTVWIAPADDIGNGHKLIARTTPLKKG